MLDFFYDAQIRRILSQCVRVFSSFNVEFGDGLNGEKQKRVVPATLANHDRMVSHIARANSENTMLATPQITINLKEVEMAAHRRQVPDFAEDRRVQERKYDQTTGRYTSDPGTIYTVSRYMPVPYDLRIGVDIWTSNLQQKLQLFEQIGTLFNPSLDIQSDVNPLDWAALTIIEMTDIQWASQSIPIGTNSEIDVLSLSFKVPIWISPPAKVQRSTLIYQIITDISVGAKFDGFVDETGNTNGLYDDTDLLTRIVTTYKDYKLGINGNFASLLNENESNVDQNGNLLQWSDLFQKYGEYRPGLSQIRIKTTNDFTDQSTDIVARIQINPNDANQLILSYDITTLPVDTLPAINAIIDPNQIYPGKNLPTAANGQRYLFLSDIGADTVAWGSLAASVNDIVQYQSGVWTVVFDASVSGGLVEFVTNSFTNRQLKFEGGAVGNTAGFWRLAIEGTYSSGFWSVGI